MSKVDWSKAYDGATHALTTGRYWGGPDYLHESVQFATLRDGGYFDEENCCFYIADDSSVVLEERPTSWNGEDGAVYRFTSGERKGEYQSEKQDRYGRLLKFRPTQTAEQMAAIDQIRVDTDWILDETQAIAILASGYRKQVKE